MTGAADRAREWVPRWWRGDGGWLGVAADVALAPAEGLFRLASRGRNRAYDLGVLKAETAGIPVVSVGNLAVGGAGKTPFAAWVAGRLREWGERPAILLRGYGEDEIEVHRELNPGVPVLAAARRGDAARAAVAAGCTVAVLDDGFQHRALRRDLDVVLVSAESWSGRRHLLPRGPWREPPSALRRAGIAVVVRKSAGPEVAEAVERAVRSRVGEIPLARCHIAPTGLRPLHGATDEFAGLDSLRGARVLAVATLADPRPFLAHLSEAGAEAEPLIFPDHHALGPAECETILARAAGRTLVMTRKEAVKLRPLISRLVPALVLDQAVVIEAGADELAGALRAAVAR